VQGESQQKPSTQLPDWHSEARVQADPFSLSGAQVEPAQWCVAIQPVSFEQVLPQALP
jgi:hypothetical protein